MQEPCRRSRGHGERGTPGTETGFGYSKAEFTAGLSLGGLWERVVASVSTGDHIVPAIASITSLSHAASVRCRHDRDSVIMFVAPRCLSRAIPEAHHAVAAGAVQRTKSERGARCGGAPLGEP